MFSLITDQKDLQPSISSNKIFDEPFKDGLYQLVVYYVSHNDPVGLILKFQSIRSVVEAFYQVMVNHKEMEPINSLEESEKLRIWKLTEGLDKRERLKASRAIYLIEMLNSDKNDERSVAMEAK